MDMTLKTTRATRVFAAATLSLALAGAWAQAPATPAVPATAATPAIPAVDVPATGSVDKLGWLVGCWQATSARDGSTINEVWLAPRAGTMMGIGQTFLGAKTTAWEAMRIYDAGSAMKIWLRPGARAELTLDLVEAKANAAGFSVTEGPITTMLRYERTSETTMLATFRLKQGENARGADYGFSRVDCAGMFAEAAKDAPKAPAAEAPKK